MVVGGPVFESRVLGLADLVPDTSDYRKLTRYRPGRPGDIREGAR
jgi:hypothetical protein